MFRQTVRQPTWNRWPHGISMYSMPDENEPSQSACACWQTLHAMPGSLASASVQTPRLSEAMKSEVAGGAVSLGGSLGDDAGVFLEGSLMTDQSGETVPSIALGATRMLTDTMQIDLFFQYDMPGPGTVVTVGSGLAFML